MNRIPKYPHPHGPGLEPIPDYLKRKVWFRSDGGHWEIWGHGDLIGVNARILSQNSIELLLSRSLSRPDTVEAIDLALGVIAAYYSGSNPYVYLVLARELAYYLEREVGEINIRDFNYRRLRECDVSIGLGGGYMNSHTVNCWDPNFDFREDFDFRSFGRFVGTVSKEPHPSADFLRYAAVRAKYDQSPDYDRERAQMEAVVRETMLAPLRFPSIPLDLLKGEPMYQTKFERIREAVRNATPADFDEALVALNKGHLHELMDEVGLSTDFVNDYLDNDFRSLFLTAFNSDKVTYRHVDEARGDVDKFRHLLTVMPHRYSRLFIAGLVRSSDHPDREVFMDKVLKQSCPIGDVFDAAVGLWQMSKGVVERPVTTGLFREVLDWLPGEFMLIYLRRLGYSYPEEPALWRLAAEVVTEVLKTTDPEVVRRQRLETDDIARIYKVGAECCGAEQGEMCVYCADQCSCADAGVALHYLGIDRGRIPLEHTTLEDSTYVMRCGVCPYAQTVGGGCWKPPVSDLRKCGVRPDCWEPDDKREDDLCDLGHTTAGYTTELRTAAGSVIKNKAVAAADLPTWIEKHKKDMVAPVLRFKLRFDMIRRPPSDKEGR